MKQPNTGNMDFSAVESRLNTGSTEQDDLFRELNNVNRRLLDSENLKSNFLSNIRNEINNPLASVLELSRNISSGYFSAGQIKRFADLIHSEIFNLDFQLRNIFLSAELEAGESKFIPASVDVPALLGNLLVAFGHQLKKRKINVLFNNTIEEGGSFHTDPEKLYHVLANVLCNAIQFSDEEGTIEVHSRKDGEKLVISILDYGIGISEQNKELLFDRFRQGEEGSTKHFAGHGLGLSVSKALLEMINGTVSIESELFHGSNFIVTINEADTVSGGYSSDGNEFLFDGQDETSF